MNNNRQALPITATPVHSLAAKNAGASVGGRRSWCQSQSQEALSPLPLCHSTDLPLLSIPEQRRFVTTLQAAQERGEGRRRQGQGQHEAGQVVLIAFPASPRSCALSLPLLLPVALSAPRHRPRGVALAAKPPLPSLPVLTIFLS